MSTIIVVNCGYVESSRACMGTAFGTDEAYENVHDAIKSLAGWLLAKWNIDHETSYKLKTCCKKHVSTANYCPSCGTNLVEEGLDQDYFAHWVSNICCGTADGWGEGWGDALYTYDSEESKLVEPHWELASLSQVVEHWDRVCILLESGDQHLAAWAVALIENPENPAPEIPSWYTTSSWQTANQITSALTEKEE